MGEINDLMEITEDTKLIKNRLLKVDNCIHKDSNCFCKIKNREILAFEDILNTCENCKWFIPEKNQLNSSIAYKRGMEALNRLRKRN